MYLLIVRDGEISYRNGKDVNFYMGQVSEGRPEDIEYFRSWIRRNLPKGCASISIRLGLMKDSVIRYAKIPLHSKKEIQAILSKNAEVFFFISPAEYNIQYKFLHLDNEGTNVLISAVSSELIDFYTETLKPVAIKYISVIQSDAVESFKSKTGLSVSEDGNKTHIMVFNKGRLVAIRDRAIPSERLRDEFDDILSNYSITEVNLVYSFLPHDFLGNMFPNAAMATLDDVKFSRSYDLLPDKDRKKRRLKRLTLKYIAAQAIIFLLIILLVAITELTISTKEKELIRLENEVNDSKYIESEETARLLNLFEDNLATIDSAALFERIFNCMPEEIYIKDAEYLYSTSKVIVSAVSFSEQEISEFIYRLSAEGEFTDVYLTDINTSATPLSFSLILSVDFYGQE